MVHTSWRGKPRLFGVPLDWAGSPAQCFSRHSQENVWTPETHSLPYLQRWFCQILAIYLLKKHTVAEPYLLAIHLSCLQRRLLLQIQEQVQAENQTGRQMKTTGGCVFSSPHLGTIVPFRAGWTSATLSGWMSCIYPPNWSRERALTCWPSSHPLLFPDTMSISPLKVLLNGLLLFWEVARFHSIQRYRLHSCYLQMFFFTVKGLYLLQWVCCIPKMSLSMKTCACLHSQQHELVGTSICASEWYLQDSSTPPTVYPQAEER